MSTRKELRRSEQEADKAGKARDELQARVIQLEASAATLAERLQQISASRDELWQLLQGRVEQEAQHVEFASQPQENKETSAN